MICHVGNQDGRGRPLRREAELYVKASRRALSRVKVARSSEERLWGVGWSPPQNSQPGGGEEERGGRMEGRLSIRLHLLSAAPL